MTTPAQAYDHLVHMVAGSDEMHALKFSAGIKTAETWNAGALISLDSSGDFQAGCADDAMPMWAINGTSDLDVARDDTIIGGGNVNAFVATGGFELFTSEYDSATGNTYNPNTFLTAATGDDEGKVTPSPAAYNSRIIVGQVSRGVVADQYSKNVLYFWPMNIPATSAS